MQRKFQDLYGQKFGRLTALTHIIQNKVTKWYCICECGLISLSNADNLKKGNTKSCGCYKNEKILDSKTIHGNSKRTGKTAEYRAWLSMRRRCSDKSYKCFNNYGGRGIKVCDEWENSFKTFLKDMGQKPTKDHTIDRIDVNGNYCKENCRWATKYEQCNNRTDSHYLNIDGNKKTIKEWSDIYNVNYHSVYSRLMRGWNGKDALTLPFRIMQQQAPQQPMQEQVQ